MWKVLKSARSRVIHMYHVDWINVSQNMDLWSTLLMMVINFLAQNVIYVCVCVCVCNMQCGAQNAKCYSIISVPMKPSFKFLSSADYCGHLIPSPKG